MTEPATPPTVTGARPPDGGEALAMLQVLSDGHVADSDFLVARPDGSAVRLSDGVYVQRKQIERRLLDRLAQPSVTALVGEAGHGKTAMLWRIHRLLRDRGRHPLVVPASALMDSPDTPVTVTVDDVRSALSHGRRTGLPVILLVDTLDLLLQQQENRLLVRKLLAVAGALRVPTLVTCRPLESKWLAPDFDMDSAPVTGVRLEAFSPAEQATAITAYSSAFYTPERAKLAAARVRHASVRGLPLRELSRNPLQLRLLFDLYAPHDLPPEDVDAIGLYDQYWQRRVHHDDRGPDGPDGGADLGAAAEAAGLVMLIDGRVEAESSRLAERVPRLTRLAADQVGAALHQLTSRGVLHQPRNRPRLRFFHQTFFEYAAARGVVGLGAGPAATFVDRVCADPLDLFVGEVTAQVVLLAARDDRLPGEFAARSLLRWLDGDANLQLLAMRTCARMATPPVAVARQVHAVLQQGDPTTAREYLRLLPSTRHPTFARLGTEYSLLWSRATTPGGDEGLGFDVLRALARSAPLFPAETRDFLVRHGCLGWLARRSLAEIRREDLHLQVLEPLIPLDPAWCTEQLETFFRQFSGATGNRSGTSPAALADMVGMFARIAERTTLPTAVTELIVDSVHLLDVRTSAAGVERAYAFLRGEALAALGPEDLLAHTREALGGESTRQWSKRGRRAELRACAHAAGGLSPAAATRHLDHLLAVRDPEHQESVVAILGEALASPHETAFTRCVRRRCVQELDAGLPAHRGPGRVKPVPMLFVNALHGADVRGTSLLAALPGTVAENVWTDEHGLLPLLAVTAQAGRDDARRVLRAVLTATLQPGTQAHTMVVKRLAHLAADDTDAARDAFAHLLDHAEATDDPEAINAVLRRPTSVVTQLRPEERARLVALRRRLTGAERGDVRDGGRVLWRLLVERLIDSPPDPAVLVPMLAGTVGPPLTSVLELTRSCARSPEWAGIEPSALVDELEHTHERALADTAGVTTKPRDRGAAVRRTHEMLARQARISVLARLSPLPDTPGHRRAAAARVAELVWDSPYDLDDDAGVGAFTECIRELGHLIRRMPEKAAAVDLLLDIARRLHEGRRRPTRWRERSARDWYGAIVATVRGAGAGDQERLVRGLLEHDADLAGAAIQACVDHVDPMPGWLAGLQPRMDDAVRETYRTALRRQAREGGRRTFDDVYDGVLEEGSPMPIGTGRPAVGIITALPEEFTAMRAMIDAPADHLAPHDRADYVLGTMPSSDPATPHEVVLTLMGDTANSAAAAACTGMVRSFPSVDQVIMAGIAAGVPRPGEPRRHVRLGDIVAADHGLVEYDHVVREVTGTRLRHPPTRASALLKARSKRLEAGEHHGDRPWEDFIDRGLTGLPDFARPDPATDVMVADDGSGTRIDHPDPATTGHRAGRPRVHRGRIGSADLSVRDSAFRDRVAQEHDLIAFEMEGKGVSSAGFAQGREWYVVRGISDYGDDTFTRQWRPYAALAAAAYVRAVLARCMPVEPRGGRSA